MEEFKHIDPEDVEDLLAKVETSFGITFVGDELVHLKNVGELCDHIANKITPENSDGCTTQQAFYKLRQAILATIQIQDKAVTLDLLLADLLPRNSRRSTMRNLESHLGFELNILRRPIWVTISLGILSLVSVVIIFFDLQLGSIGLVSAITGFWVTGKIGRELDLKTVGQVAEKMVRENYIKSRRNPMTFNKNEIRKILIDWFNDDLILDQAKLIGDKEVA